MLSRVANAVYWMNCYIERAESYARFLDVNFNLSLDLPNTIKEQWKPLIIITGDWKFYEKRFGVNVDKEKAIFFLVFDTENPNSIINSITQARENARLIRPEITQELWQQINYIYFELKKNSEKELWKSYELEDSSDLLVKIKHDCQLLYGIFDTTMSRNLVWHFGRIGQLLERADKTSRVLDVKYHILLPSIDEVGSPLDILQWAALLKSVSAYDMYRRKYGKLTPSLISEFLILDKEFPRSVFSCVQECGKSLKALSKEKGRKWNDAERKLGLLNAQLEYADIDSIFQEGLHEYINNLQIKLNEVFQKIYETYFSLDRFNKI